MLLDLAPTDCRYVVAQLPSRFCAEPAVGGSSYCGPHRRACHVGFGKDWQALAGMMGAVEQHIRPTSSFEHERPETAGVDIELKEGK